MKKKTLALVLCLALMAVAVVGGTLAYFTDTDQEDNVFALGGLKIDLIEQQRNADGTALEDFKDDKVLLPIVGSAQTDPKDEFGLTTAKNYVDKVITVKNNGPSDAYIRLFLAIPADLDNAVPNFDASLNVLHFNYGNLKWTDGNWYTTYKSRWDWLNDNNELQFFETKIGDDGIKYSVYYAYYYKALANGATTERAINGLYFDKGVDFNEAGYMTITRDDGETAVVPGNWTSESNIKIPVFVQAVQAAGFDNAEAAFAASGLPTNPWTTTTTTEPTEPSGGEAEQE